MKKIILLLLISLAGSVANAQYKTFYFGGIQYNANCFYNKKGFITIDIQLQSLDNYEVKILIGTEIEYQSFMRRLNYLKSNMIEWDSVCIKNDINDIDKLIEYQTKKKEIPTIWFGRYFNDASLISVYTRNNGKSQIIIHSGEISALTNEYIKCKGGVLVFHSPQDIEDMITAFDLSQMQNYINEINRKESLLQ